MASLPSPPAILPPLRKSDVRVVRKGTHLWRVYVAAGSDATSWERFRTYGPVSVGRFDHHVPPAHEQDRGVLYAAVNHGPTAVAEAFQETRTIDRRARAPWLVSFELNADLSLLDLGGLWPTRAGASQAINSGLRDVTRAWSREIYSGYPDVMGLWYPSAMFGGRKNVALYERANRALPERPSFHAPLLHPGLALPLERVANEVGYRLI